MPGQRPQQPAEGAGDQATGQLFPRPPSAREGTHALTKGQQGNWPSSPRGGGGAADLLNQEEVARLALTSPGRADYSSQHISFPFLVPQQPGVKGRQPKPPPGRLGGNVSLNSDVSAPL